MGKDIPGRIGIENTIVLLTPHTDMRKFLCLPGALTNAQVIIIDTQIFMIKLTTLLADDENPDGYFAVMIVLV